MRNVECGMMINARFLPLCKIAKNARYFFGNLTILEFCVICTNWSAAAGAETALAMNESFPEAE